MATKVGVENEGKRLNRQWIIRTRPDGMVEPSVFEKRTVELPENLTKGQVLAKVLYLSFDPAQRLWLTQDSFPYMPMLPLGTPMKAASIAQVIESKHGKFRPGDLIVGDCDWQEYVLFDPDSTTAGDLKVPRLLPYTKIPTCMDLKHVVSFITGGATGFVGMVYHGNVKAGDTVLVSGAAGNVGSIAGQIAKIKGATRVIGITGGTQKCAWLMEKGHFDAAIDYKNENVDARLSELCPNGVNLFFDNVGGKIMDTALNHLAVNARIVFSGMVSQYNNPGAEPTLSFGVENFLQLAYRRATLKGFLIFDYLDRYSEILSCLNHWVGTGEIALAVDMQEGFDNIPSTLLRIFTGANLGKQVLQLCEPPLPVPENRVERTLVSVMGRYFAWKHGTSR